jgi:hypothetical protein
MTKELFAGALAYGVLTTGQTVAAGLVWGNRAAVLVAIGGAAVAFLSMVAQLGRWGWIGGALVLLSWALAFVAFVELCRG